MSHDSFFGDVSDARALLNRAVWIDVLKWIKSDKPSAGQLEAKLEADQTWDCILVRLCLARCLQALTIAWQMMGRWLTSCHIKSHAKDFEAFLGGKTVEQFCKSDVSPRLFVHFV